MDALSTISTNGSHGNIKNIEIRAAEVEAPEPAIPHKYWHRKSRLRPILPEFDYMVLPNYLAYVMSWYGLLIGKFPAQVMCLMIGMGIVFAAGLSRLTMDTMETDDFLPVDSPSLKESSKHRMFDFSEQHDPSEFVSIYRSGIRYPKYRNTSWRLNKDGFPMPSRRRSKRAATYVGPDGRKQSCRVNTLLIVAKKNVSDPTHKSYNLFKKQMLDEIEELESIIYNLTIKIRTSRGQTGSYKYEDKEHHSNSLCTKQQDGTCGGFTLRVVRTLFPDIENRDPVDLLFSRLPGVALTWPRYRKYDFSSFFGKVETLHGLPNERVTHIGAMRQVYCINQMFDYFLQKIKIWERWERRFNQALREYENPYFDVYWMSEEQKSKEQDELTTSMLPKLLITFAALMLWCSVSALMGDAVRSKPWAGFLGVFSTLIACAAGFGIQLWMEPKFQVILMAVPLLTLAIGLDDMFILLEAWSCTNPRLPVEERMMLSMNVGGTSIILTFFINMLDFIIGNYTPFPVIQLLSEYAIATMVLDFFFQMTVFAPSVVLLSRLEEINHHSCCCALPVDSREEAISKGMGDCYLTCCAGGFFKDTVKKQIMGDVNPAQAKVDNAEKESVLVRMASNFITALPFQIIAIIVFVVYISLAVWSITKVEVGLKAERIYRESSNYYGYFQQHRLLFTGYGKEITVSIVDDLDYSSPKVREKLFDMMHKVEQSGYFWVGDETQSWLREFEAWAIRSNVSLSRLTSNQDVLYQLRRWPNGFLDSNNPRTGDYYGATDKFGKSIKMDPNATRIMMSRLKFRTKEISGPARQMGMMVRIREILKSYEPDIKMVAYHDEFRLFDQFVSTVPTTLYYCGITLGVTIGIALIMVPHPACLFWVFIFVISVLSGIVGLMRLWGMDLDPVSLINLLIAVSFCSDLIAHPIYIFMVSPAVSAAGKPLRGRQARIVKAKAVVREVIGAAVPACVGTTLSVIAMSTSDAYIFITFFRVMFLAVLLSILHALIFVPTFLSFIGPSSSKLQFAIRTGNKTAVTPESAESQTEETPSSSSGNSSSSSKDLVKIVERHKRSRSQGQSRYREKPYKVSKSTDEEEEPIYYSGPASIRASRMRGALARINNPMIPRYHYYSFQKQMPPTITRIINLPHKPLRSSQLERVKEELRRNRTQFEQGYLAPKSLAVRQKTASQRKASPASSSRRTSGTPALPRITQLKSSSDIRRNSTNTSGLGSSQISPGVANITTVLSAPRMGASMLPARHRFNI